MSVCECVCVRACVRACVRVCELYVRGGQRVCEGCVWVQALEEVQPRLPRLWPCAHRL